MAINQICSSIGIQVDKVRRLRIVVHSTRLIHGDPLLLQLLHISHVHVVDAGRLLHLLPQ